MTIEQINELIENLKSNLEWAIANEWESPIDLSDNLVLAIKGLKELKQWNKLLAVEEHYTIPKVDLEKMLKE